MLHLEILFEINSDPIKLVSEAKALLTAGIKTPRLYQILIGSSIKAGRRKDDVTDLLDQSKAIHPTEKAMWEMLESKFK